MPRELFWTLVLALSSIVTSSCTSVTIPNSRVCADLGVAGATCDNTLSSSPVQIKKNDWDKMRVGWFCLNPQDFSDTESALDQLCQQDDNCDYSVVQASMARLNKLNVKKSY